MNLNNLHYRAWHKERKEMCQVLSMCFVNRYVEVLPEQNLEGGETELWEWDDIELMEVTDFIDNHNKRIWEGDVVQTYCYNTIYKHEVKKTEDGILAGRTKLNTIYFKGAGKEFKVLGNIYENPNLLTNGN